MYFPVFVLNGNAGSFVQHRNKILNVGYVSCLPLSLGAVVCVFLWSTYASYWSDRCSPQQSQSFSQQTGERREGRESGKTDERQGKTGERREEWWSVTEWERKKGESLWVGGGGDGGDGCDRKRWGGRRRGAGRLGGRKEDLMNVDHCPST